MEFLKVPLCFFVFSAASVVRRKHARQQSCSGLERSKERMCSSVVCLLRCPLRFTQRIMVVSEPRDLPRPLKTPGLRTPLGHQPHIGCVDHLSLVAPKRLPYVRAPSRSIIQGSRLKAPNSKRYLEKPPTERVVRLFPWMS